MLTIYLCDDNQVILNQYQVRISQIAEKNHLPVRIRTFNSGASMLFAMEDEAEGADIIFLDIVMAGENGIEVASSLRERGYDAALIFLTANPQFVFDSFDVRPTYYMIKGEISDQRFEEIFLKASENAKKTVEKSFICSSGSVQKHIAYKDIYYFEVTNRIMTVHYGEEKFSFYTKMEALEKSLEDKNFIRVHRSFLVQLSCIEEISKDGIVLINKEKLPLGVTYVKGVKMALNQYLSKAAD